MLIEINENSRVPKYQQIINSIIYNVSSGNLIMGQKIPSINIFSEEFYLSRDTVEKAYRILKKRNIISSIKGKGYYISKTNLTSKVKILFLVNKLSSYKVKIYNSFKDNLGSDSQTDLHIYHCDESLFLNLLNKYKFEYDFFIIMPHFKTEDLRYLSFTDKVKSAIDSIPQEKIIILDNLKISSNSGLRVVYQDFENDIYHALIKGKEKIKKYKKIILFYPEKSEFPYPRRILIGFRKFAVEHNLDFEIFNEVNDDMILKKGDLFIAIEETDLVRLIKKIRFNELVIGQEIGVISYNDTPLKNLLGITVMSTDFKAMGKMTADMMLNMQKDKVKVPFDLLERNSL